MLEGSIEKKVFMPENGEHFIFPLADGTVQLSGRDQVVRKSTSIQDYPERGEDHNDDFARRIGQVSTMRHVNG